MMYFAALGWLKMLPRKAQKKPLMHTMSSPKVYSAQRHDGARSPNILLPSTSPCCSALPQTCWSIVFHSLPSFDTSRVAHAGSRSMTDMSSPKASSDACTYHPSTFCSVGKVV
eukprot:CAMPEP_0206265208 /NCGR_PEP_ID=MMETSP0047_2-20121206/29857_1 /ASSEMBLY_ACC=CAM_ASM_000192 /TAXON_ID=195065 /ORGANISM="Chroomonas mesostigmatica_cf, Strain CCMP1168" /LENGTH=112 /DNA_ID=CAMNT_0053693057 /DNA_START=37 /DNA_END=375 /DNA_ORIENTATION=+